MQTWDAADFADWLEALGSRQFGSQPPMVFPDINLQLNVIAQTDQEVTLHIYFVLEQPGEWDMDDAIDGRRNYIGVMDFRLPRAALRIAAESLRAELLRFPTRGT